MTSSKDKFSRTVKFAQTEADQVLLEAIEKALQSQSYSSFSDLCKQALRQLLLPAESAPGAAVMNLQQQLNALQIQVAKLEGAAHLWQSCPIGRLEQHLTEVTHRVEQLEAGAVSSSSAQPDPVAAPEAIDPLLSRLAPLLEDF
jgi:TolA-binding protein